MKTGGFILLCIFLFCGIGCSHKSSADSDDSDSVTDFDSSGDSDSLPIVENCTDGWCTIPGGTFLYGSPPEHPCRSASAETQVLITLTHPFEILNTEMTQKMWTEMGFENPSKDVLISPQYPVVATSWYDTLAWCNAMSEKKGSRPLLRLVVLLRHPGTPV